MSTDRQTELRCNFEALKVDIEYGHYTLILCIEQIPNLNSCVQLNYINEIVQIN